MRRFTASEADALLPRLVPLLETLRDVQARCIDLSGRAQNAATGNGGGGAARELEREKARANELIGELQELGVVVRDPATGLIDFPAVRDGEEIFLCWRLGEDRVAWWHPTTSGFADRRPLD